MSNQPLRRGRVAAVVGTFESQNGTKNRWATVGKATLWPGHDGGYPQTQIEIDTLPLGAQAGLKLSVFWDEQQGGQQTQQAQQPQQGYGRPLPGQQGAPATMNQQAAQQQAPVDDDMPF